MAKFHAAEALEATIPADGVELKGDLRAPQRARAAVLFAHGSGSSRHSPRNRLVAAELDRAGLATLLMDLLTLEEAEGEASSGRLRFDIPLLARRLAAASDWLNSRPETAGLPLGYFGASTGAGAALMAAAARPDVYAVVSRGGRPDLALGDLPRVKAPVLLIVGGKDREVLELNEEAARRLRCEHRVEVVPGATHLFEEPGALEAVARSARDWFLGHIPERP